MTALAAEQELKHLGESQGIANHDHDLVHELSRRLDAVWRYDQYIANADGHESLQRLWKKLKQQEAENVEELKGLIAKHVKEDCF